MNVFRRNIPLLALAQAIMMSSTSLMITAASLVGYALADNKALATAPLAAAFITTMLTSVPAAWLMHHIGRKAGFILATLIGASGATLAAWAIIEGWFTGFVLGAALVGAHNAFGNYYRFAAADAVPAPLKGHAISWVLAGGIAAAFVGPNLANFSHDWISGAPFAGGFLAVTILYLCATAALSFLQLPPQAEDHVDPEQPVRPLTEIARQPPFIVALICGTLGYGVMSLVMTATPLAMSHHHHALGETSFVIQWHVLAMFAPSFFTGRLIERWGIPSILRQGALIGLSCVAINLAGTSLWHFWVALILLGLSWNFLFIGATTLLTRAYRPAEKAKVQAANDFAVFTTVTLASLSAGALQHLFGWQSVNLGVIPPLFIALGAGIWYGRLTAPSTATTAA